MSDDGIKVRGIGPYLFILPMVIGISIFGFYALFYVFRLSLFKSTLLTSEYVGLKNYTYIFKEKWFLTSLMHTLYYALWSVPLNLIVGLTLAFALHKKMKFGTMFRFIYLLPWVSSTVIVALIFRYIFNPEWGIMNWFLGIFGINKIMWTENYLMAIPVIATMGAWQNAGFGMIIFLGAITSIPKQIFEASDLDGCNEFKKFWYITIPLLKPVIFFYLVISLITAFQVFDAVYAFLEGTPGAGAWTIFTSPIQVSAYFVYSVGFKMFSFGRSAAMGIVMFAIVLTIIIIQKFSLGKNYNFLGKN